MGNGDGTVPLISLGYMCSRGWSEVRAPRCGAARVGPRARLQSARNPGSIRVTTREYLQTADSPSVLGRLPADVLGAIATAGAPMRARALRPPRRRAVHTAAGLRGALDALRGSAAADHVDILLNDGMLRDVLSVATGGSLQPAVLSDIEAISRRVAL